MIDYYKILGLQPNATVVEIKRAFRKKAKLYHPDINKAPNATEMFILISEAYEYVLRDKLRQKETAHYSRYHQKSREQASYNQWFRDERQKARERAERYARMKYEDFEQSKLYKSAMLIASLTDFFFIFIGLFIIAIPLFVTFTTDMASVNPQNHYTAVTASIIIGLIISVTLILNKLNTIKRKDIDSMKSNQKSIELT